VTPLEIRANGDIWLDGALIISQRYGYDTWHAETVREMVEAWNAREASKAGA
jgi:hypothetical protein